LYKFTIIKDNEAQAYGADKLWFHYVISNGHNTITGYRCGTKKEVQDFAQATVDKLNHKYPRSDKRFIKTARDNNSGNSAHFIV